MATIIQFADRRHPRQQPVDPAPDPWTSWLLLVAAQLELTASLLRLMAGGGR